MKAGQGEEQSDASTQLNWEQAGLGRYVVLLCQNPDETKTIGSGKGVRATTRAGKQHITGRPEGSGQNSGV